MIQVTIEASKLVQLLKKQFSMRTDQFERYIEEGEYLTFVISDGPFEVPSQIGGVNVVASKQIGYPNGAIALAEVLTRG